MAASHTYNILYPQYSFLYLIGRFAFPIFAWSIAIGAVYTRDTKHYLLRLIMLAVISQVPYVVAHRVLEPTFWDLNVVFTLAGGLLSVMIIQKKWNTLLTIAAVALIATAAQLLLMDYGAFGVMSVVSFYLFRNQFGKLFIAQSVILFGLLWHSIREILQLGIITPNHILFFGNVLSLVALVIIQQYNGRQGPKLKYLFYVFYPLHFVVLYLLARMIYG